jgi:hypothetical protein
MAGKKEPGMKWHHTTVLVRGDIFENAHDRGVDISDVCNRALAEVLGIDYCQQLLGSVPVPHPVIIAKDGGLPVPEAPAPQSSQESRHPVINADDPAAAGTISRNRKQRIPEPVHEVSRKKVNTAEDPAPQPRVKDGESRPVSGPQKKAAKKGAKVDGLRKFIAAKLIREDAEDAVIRKEELYQVFSRWCREQKISPVPEEKTIAVSLKTRFAFRDRIIGGSPCWVNLRLQ